MYINIRIASGCYDAAILFAFFLCRELGSRVQPSEISVEVPSEISKSYESEFPALGFMTLDEKAKVWSGSTTDDSDKMADALLALNRTEPNQETNEFTVSTQEQVEVEVQSADSMESLVGFFQRLIFVHHKTNKGVHMCKVKT